MKILYIGNKHFKHKKTKSVLETLEVLFQEFVEIKTCSDKKNKLIRLFDMFYYFMRYGLFYDKIIIDVYSTTAIYFAYIFSLLSIIFKKKYILFLHGGNLPKKYEASPKKINFIFTNAQKVISPSKYLHSFFTKNDYKIKLIPNIIEIEKYPFFERKKIRPKILSLRGFSSIYNPMMTLEAVKLLRSEFTNIELLMLGNPNDELYSDVKNFIINNNLENNIIVQNKLPLKKWIELSKDYDIMVSNPIIDNTPISLIEGMALGMCLISTNVGGVPFLVENDSCILIEDNNTNELVKGIKDLIENRELASNLSLAGRKLSEKYSWDSVKEKWKNVLLN